MTLEAESLMDLDGLDEAPPAAPERMRLWQVALDVLVRPSAAFGRLAEHPGRRWLWPALAMALLVTAYGVAVVLSPTTGEAIEAATSQMGEEIMSVLRDLHARGTTIVMVTHDARLTERTDRIVRLFDGRQVQ